MKIFKVRDKHGLTFYSTCKNNETQIFSTFTEEKGFEILNSVVVTGLAEEFLDYNGLLDIQEIFNLLSFKYSENTNTHRTVLTNIEMLKFNALAKALDLMIIDCFPINKKTFDYIKSLEDKNKKLEFEILDLKKDKAEDKTDTRTDDNNENIFDLNSEKFSLTRLVLGDLISSLSQQPGYTKESIEKIIETIARKARVELKDIQISKEMEENAVSEAKKILEEIYKKR